MTDSMRRLGTFIKSLSILGLSSSSNCLKISIIAEKSALVGLDNKLKNRSVNEGFSGGEKKRCEILQMSMLDPKYCLMDETDSGLDIDALRIVSEGVNHMRSQERGFLVITHYQRLLDYIIPDVVHVMYDGRIVHSGDKELAKELEVKGYDWVKEQFANAAV